MKISKKAERREILYWEKKEWICKKERDQKEMVLAIE
jgi:hypothetical protein